MNLNELFTGVPTRPERVSAERLSERECDELKASLDRQIMQVFGNNNPIKTK